MTITCPRCRKEIPGSDINIQTSIAKCTTCNEVFSIAVPASSLAQPAQQRPMVPKPQAITESREMGDYVLTRRWFSCVVIPLLIFCIPWDGFLIFWYAIAFKAHAPLIMVIFPIGHLAVGVSLTYYVLCGLLNRTDVRINNRLVTVRHYPMPWLGNRQIPAGEIDQVYCTVSYGNRGAVTYRVNVIKKSGECFTLLNNLPNAEQARYIEQTIEEHLNIPDRPVAGEMR